MNPLDDEGPIDTLEGRQASRLREVPELYQTTHELLAVELSLHMENADEIFERYNYTPDQAAELCESPAFLKLLERVGKEVRESGLSFRMKAKAISEGLLPHAWDIATDPLCSAAVRASIIFWAAKVSGNEPKEAKDDAKAGSGLTLSITFAGNGNEPKTVLSTHDPLTIEHQS
jgi:hypothetical protein